MLDAFIADDHCIYVKTAKLYVEKIRSYGEGSVEQSVVIKSFRSNGKMLYAIQVTNEPIFRVNFALNKHCCRCLNLTVVCQVDCLDTVNMIIDAGYKHLTICH